MAILKLGTTLLLLIGTLEAADANIFDECRKKHIACHGNCTPGGFSCDLLRDRCGNEFKRCVGLAGPTPSYDDSPTRPTYQPPAGTGGTYQPPVGGGEWQH